MRNSKFFNFFLFSLLFLASLGGHDLRSFAEGKENDISNIATIAIVDVEKIMDGLESFSEFKKNIEEERLTNEKQLELKMMKLKEEDEDLRTKVSILSEDAMRGKMAKLQERYMKLQEEAKDKVTLLQNKLNVAVAIIDRELRNITTELIKEEKYSSYSIILSRQVILYYSEKDDITMEVLKRLNRKKLNLQRKATGKK
ncbi:MAG: OmpH family outer membrane protein [Rickettsiales bacterium]|nr:OmpH family outer membrane protein [Rickettsiales bacterium]